jgi:hypothetical protein
MRRKRHTIVFSGLILIIAAVFAYAFAFRYFVGIYIGDTSDHEMVNQIQNTLKPEHLHFFISSLERIADVYLIFLVITNVLWLVGAFYFFKRWRKDSRTA